MIDRIFVGRRVRRWSSILPALVLFGGVVGAGCTTTDDVSVGSQDLIVFPDAAYKDATPIAYGQKLTVPFTAADEFVAVKFQGMTGDRVAISVSALRATVAYLVFDRKNVAALRPDGLTYQLTSAGEYFIMMRSRDRKDVSIDVELLLQGGSGSGGVSYQELVASAGPGQAPIKFLSNYYVKTVRRDCVPATGCSAGNQDFGGYVNIEVDATPSGKVVGRIAGYAGTGTGSMTFDASTPGIARGRLSFGTQVFDVTFTHGATGGLLELRSELSRSGTSWSEIWGSGQVTWGPFPSRESERELASTPHPNADIVIDDALSDEEVLSRFPNGSGELVVHASNAPSNYAFRGSRSCGPRTGCSAWTRSPIGVGDTEATLFGKIRTSASASLRVSGVDSYEVVFRNGTSVLTTIPIENGKGTFKTPDVTYEVRVTESGVAFIAPVQTKTTSSAKSFWTLTEGATETEDGYTDETYSNPTLVFSAKWQ